jgi:hypothetical protein
MHHFFLSLMQEYFSFFIPPLHVSFSVSPILIIQYLLFRHVFSRTRIKIIAHEVYYDLTGHSRLWIFHSSERNFLRYSRPLSLTSGRWYTDSYQQPCLKLNCALQGDCMVTNPNQPKVTNTSNLSLDRDPTGGNTHSREIQRGYAHFSAS